MSKQEEKDFERLVSIIAEDVKNQIINFLKTLDFKVGNKKDKFCPMCKADLPPKK